MKLGALTPAAVIIHGSALTRNQPGQAADAQAKLVWSPQSNLRLYGETTRVSDALDVGLPIALGADWLPSGSTSLLAEMKVARQELANQGHLLSAADLVAMVTTGAAEIAGLGEKLGKLEIGRPADVLVLARCNPEPFESVCAATPNDVELVLIGGDLTYGRTDWVRTLAQDPADPNLEPTSPATTPKSARYGPGGAFLKLSEGWSLEDLVGDLESTRRDGHRFVPAVDEGSDLALRSMQPILSTVHLPD